MNDIVIFGSTGFIGSNINNFLIKERYNVNGFSSVTCNLLDQSEIRKVFTLINNDFNLIICSLITRSVDDSLESMFKNIQMINNVVESVPIDRVKSIIYLSSVDIYGLVKYSCKIDENTPQRSVGYYGLSKLACEHLLYHNIQEIPITVLRLPGIYGYRDNYKSVVGKLIKDGFFKKEIKITNDGSCLRDYVEISDLCKIVNHFILNPFNGTVIVATGQSISVREITEIVINKLNNNAVITNLKTNSSSSDFLFDNSLLRSIMPSFNFTDINTGIERYIKTL